MSDAKSTCPDASAIFITAVYTHEPDYTTFAPGPDSVQDNRSWRELHDDIWQKNPGSLSLSRAISGRMIARLAIDIRSHEWRLVPIGDAAPAASAYHAALRLQMSVLADGKFCVTAADGLAHACPRLLLRTDDGEVAVCTAESGGNCAVVPEALCVELGGFPERSDYGWGGASCVSPDDFDLAFEVAATVAQLVGDSVDDRTRARFLSQSDADIHDWLRGELWRIKGAVAADIQDLRDTALKYPSGSDERIEFAAKAFALSAEVDLLCGIDTFLETTEHPDAKFYPPPIEQRDQYNRSLNFFSPDELVSLRAGGYIKGDMLLALMM